MSDHRLLSGRVDPPSRPRRIGLITFTACGLVAVLGTFMPWLHTGSTSRSSYDLLGLVTRLGFAPDGVLSFLVQAWPAVPLLLTSAVVLAWWGRSVAALAISIIGTVYTGGVSLTLAIRSANAPIDLGIGPIVCSIGSIGFLGSAVAVVITNRSGGS